MLAQHFKLPVRIQLPEQPVLEIYCVDEALDFLLQACDAEDDSSGSFNRAVEACFMASIDRADAETARWFFTAYAQDRGILTDDVPIVIIGVSEIRALH